MKEIAKFIDHTNLKPDAAEIDIRNLCEEARKYDFASVCINPYYVKLAKELLKGSEVKVCTVIGFPLGATTTEIKVLETTWAIMNGADEIDMVINIGALKDGKDGLVKDEIGQVVLAAKDRIVKVILECCCLTIEEKKRACRLAKKAGAHFVKTSTGFGKHPTGGFSGATIEDVKLMKEVFGGEVKAAGGIRTLKQVREFIKAGATRIGASASVEIMKEVENEKSKV